MSRDFMAGLCLKYLLEFKESLRSEYPECLHLNVTIPSIESWDESNGMQPLERERGIS